MIFAFGNFELDIQRAQLHRGDEEVMLQRKAYELLRVLIEHRDRPVPRQELMERVWGGAKISDNVMNVVVAGLRKTLGQTKGDAGPVVTIYGRGYRFVADVRMLTPSRSESTRPGVEMDSAIEVFVGREALMRSLQKAFAQARMGRGQARVLSGEPGAGKTRLAHEHGAWAASSGVDAWWGRCHQDPDVPAFWPWLSILRKCAQTLTDASRATLTREAPEILTLLPELMPAAERKLRAHRTASDNEGRQYRLFEAVTRLLQASASDRLRLIVLDDLQWADAASLELLAYLMPELATRRVLVVATLRDADLGANQIGRAVINSALRHDHCRRLSVGPLTRPDVDEYVAGILGHDDPSLSASVFERTEGNAFFTTEALRSVRSAGAPDGSRPALPDGALDIVRDRMTRLGRGSYEVLQMGAIIGRSFDLSILQQLSERDPGTLLTVLQQPIEMHLLTTRPDDRRHFDFHHGLIRDTLVNELSLADRRRLHLKVASIMQERFDTGLPVSPQELAHHLFEALPHDRVALAVSASVEAAEAALRVCAFDDARRHFGRALEAMHYAPQGEGATESLRLRLSMADAGRLSGQVEAARVAFCECFDVARRANAWQEVARAAIGWRACQPMYAVPDAPADDALRQALAMTPPEATAVRARLLSRLAGVSDMETRRTMSERAASLAEAIDDPATHRDVLLARIHAVQGPDLHDERQALADDLIALADGAGMRHWRWEGHHARYEIALRRGDMTAADQELDQLEALADALSHPIRRYEARNLRLTRRLCSGDFVGGDAAISAVAEQGGAAGHPFANHNFLAQVSLMLRDRGQLAVVAKGGAEYERRYPWPAVNLRAVLALHALEAGDLDAARAHYGFFANEDFANVMRQEDYPIMTSRLGLVAAEIGTPGELDRLYDMLTPYAARNLVNHPLLYLGTAEYPLGVMAARLGRTETAREHLERSLTSNLRLGVAATVIRTRIALGALLAESDGPRALSLWQQAAADAEARGMAGLAREALESLKRQKGDS